MPGFPWGPKKPPSPSETEASKSAPTPAPSPERLISEHMFPNGGVTGAEVAQVLIDRGFRAELSNDRDGDPLIHSGCGGIKYCIYFYTPREARYGSLQFSAGFATKDKMSSRRILEWNRSKRFGRAFLDSEGDPIVQMDIDVERGFTVESLANYLERWDGLVIGFRNYVFQKD